MRFFGTYWRILAIPPSMAFILFSIFGTINAGWTTWLIWFALNVVMALFIFARLVWAYGRQIQRSGH